MGLFKRKSDKPDKSGTRQLIDWTLTLVIAVGLAFLVQAFLVKPYSIPSASMEPTITEGQRVLANRLAVRSERLTVGSVAVFHPPQGAEIEEAGCRRRPRAGSACATVATADSKINFIKRIVAGPGDRLAVRRGRVILNGRPTAEPFAKIDCQNEPVCNLPRPITIPANSYFMMGDNRGHSYDSRFWGPVPKEWIIGTAFASYWPPNRIGPLH